MKQPTPKIEPFLYIETLGNPLTTPSVLVNRGPQVDSDATDHDAKRHKDFMQRMLMGSSDLKYEMRV